MCNSIFCLNNDILTLKTKYVHQNTQYLIRNRQTKTNNNYIKYYHNNCSSRFLLSTYSGLNGRPNEIEIEHRNIRHNMCLLKKKFNPKKYIK